MKLLVIIGILTVSLFRFGHMQQWALDNFEIEVKKKCLQDMGIVNSQEIINKNTEPSQQYKCFLNCFLNGISFMRNHTIQDDVVIGVLEQRRFDNTFVKKALKLCKNSTQLSSSESGSDRDCDRAYKAIKCLKDNVPDGYSRILI